MESFTSAVLHRDIHDIPHRIVEAHGKYLTLSDNRKILDSTGGAGVSCIGHGDERVLAAIQEQARTLSYGCSIFFSTPSGEGLADFLVNSTGGQMSKALIVSSGSEAMETALKLCRQYFLELTPPQPQRTRFIARRQSYHGNTLGALAVSGHFARRLPYEPLLTGNVSHVSPCNTYRYLRENEPEDEYVSRLAEELEAEFQRVGPHTVCAFVAEPVVGAASGCVPSVRGYFAAMRAVCERHGALLLMDEVMSGMGRTGTLHAWQQEHVVPDIQTIGKGLGAGYMPVAGVLVGPRVVEALDKGTGKFVNGFTYQGHALACAAALAVQRVIQSDSLLANVRVTGNYLGQALQRALAAHPHVGNVRGRGLFWGIEFVADRATKKPFPPAKAVAMAVHLAALAAEPQGIMLYPGTGAADEGTEETRGCGDQVLLCPPYNVTQEECDVIVRVTKDAIETALGKGG